MAASGNRRARTSSTSWAGDHVSQEKTDLGRGADAGDDRRDRLDLHLHGVLDVDDDLARDGVEQLAELAGHNVHDLLGPVDEVEVATARIGHGGQELLVEVGPDAEGARRDTGRAQVGRDRGQLGGVDDADVRLSIGQDQASVHTLGRQVLLDLLGTGDPATVEVGRAARVDRLKAQQRLLLGPGGREAGADYGLDLLVVGHDAESVPGAEPLEGAFDGVFREADLGPGHGAGAVEDERHVDRRPLGQPGAGAALWRGHLNEHEPAAAVAGADEVAVCLGGEVRGHGATLSAARDSSVSRFGLRGQFVTVTVTWGREKSGGTPPRASGPKSCHNGLYGIR